MALRDHWLDDPCRPSMAPVPPSSRHRPSAVVVEVVIRGACPTSPSHTTAWPSEPQTSHRRRCPALGTCPRAAQLSRDSGWSLCPFESPKPSFKPDGCHQISHYLPTSREGQDALWEVRAVGSAEGSNSTGMSSVLALCPWTQDILHLSPKCSIPRAQPFTAAMLEPPALSPGKPKGAENEAAVELELRQGQELTSVLQYRLD